MLKLYLQIQMRFFFSATYFQHVDIFDNAYLNIYPRGDYVHCAGTTPLLQHTETSYCKSNAYPHIKKLLVICLKAMKWNIKGTSST